MTGPFTAARAALARLAVSTGVRPPLTSGWLSGSYPDTLRGGVFHRTLDYSLYIPYTVSGRNRVPLLVMLHGCSQDARGLARGARIDALADQQRLIVLYPQQSVRANPMRCWNWFSARTRDGAGEAAAIVALVRQVLRRYPIDRTRVYVAGMSAGGAMTTTLALCHGAVFAGCAIVSGLMYGAADSAVAAAQAMRAGARRSPERAAEAAREVSRRPAFVPALVMHGGADTLVHPRNAEQIVAQLLRFAQLTLPAPELLGPIERRVSGNGRTYRQRDYSQGDRIVLRSIVIDGLGHAWSGGDGHEAFNDPTPPDATALMWEFLRELRRPAAPRWPLLRLWLRQVRRALRR